MPIYPPINRTESFNSIGQVKDSTGTSPVPVTLRKRVTVRSATTANFKDSSGFRKPGSYTSSILNYVVSPTATLTTKFSDGSLNTEYSGGAGWGSYSPQWDLGPFSSRVQNQALTKALLKLQDQKVNLAQAFAETKETADLFRGACYGLADLVNQIKRAYRNPWDAWKRGFGRVPDALLQAQFGWRPLMQDIYGSIEVLQHKNRAANGYRATVTGNGKDGARVLRDWPDSQYGFHLIETGDYQGHVSLTFNMASPAIATLSSIGLTNPAYVVWEKIPYSFVVDWFLPVGNWLNSMTADYGWEWVAGCYSETRNFVTQNTAGFSHPIGKGGQYVSGEFGNSSGYNFTRLVYTSSPVPGIFLKNPLSSLHVAEALALLVQAFR
jgi:hypothetical protein